ncbi:MAG: hypothetical protein HZC17_04080 [Candidatus Omnitrophica bacterium]|nr:hypothetical protein [Candidatus Omnitrophota bacterium]
MKNKIFSLVAVVVFLMGCATTQPSGYKIVVWETSDVHRPYEVLGPVSVTVDVTEKTEDTVQGLAGFISKDGRVSDQMPPDMRKALELKSQKYKEMIFEKLGAKAKEYGASAVIGADYLYVPAYASFSTKATVSAKGTMIIYKQK